MIARDPTSPYSVGWQCLALPNVVHDAIRYSYDSGARSFFQDDSAPWVIMYPSAQIPLPVPDLPAVCMWPLGTHAFIGWGIDDYYLNGTHVVLYRELKTRTIVAVPIDSIYDGRSLHKQLRLAHSRKRPLSPCTM